MKHWYDPVSDAFYMRFSDAMITESEESRPGVVFDFDADGHLVAIEVLDAREKLAPDAIKNLMAAE
ncbi:MAG: DUF2283 domain-containing protein [Beijerinckiaceae bacterium]